MANRTVPPGGCRWCGAEKQGHFTRDDHTAGPHEWTPPTQAQIKARELDRRRATLDERNHLMPPSHVPYDDNGNLLHFPATRYTYDNGVRTEVPYDWRPNEPFTATMTMYGMSRGRSAAYFHWTDSEGHRFPMFMKDLGDLLRAATLVRGTITGRWDVAKRGENYGLRYLSPADSDDQAVLVTRAELVDALTHIQITDMPVPKDGVIELSAYSLADTVIAALTSGKQEVQG